MMRIIRRTFVHMDKKWFSLSPFLMKYITALENGQRRTTKLIPGFKDLE